MVRETTNTDHSRTLLCQTMTGGIGFIPFIAGALASNAGFLRSGPLLAQPFSQPGSPPVVGAPAVNEQVTYGGIGRPGPGIGTEIVRTAVFHRCAQEVVWLVYRKVDPIRIHDREWHHRTPKPVRPS